MAYILIGLFFVENRDSPRRMGRKRSEKCEGARHTAQGARPKEQMSRRKGQGENGSLFYSTLPLVPSPLCLVPCALPLEKAVPREGVEPPGNGSAVRHISRSVTSAWPYLIGGGSFEYFASQPGSGGRDELRVPGAGGRGPGNGRGVRRTRHPVPGTRYPVSAMSFISR